MTLDWTPCAQHSTGWQDATVPENECTTYLRSIGFDPLPKQYDAITCPVDDEGYGGARGGAKSHTIAGDWLWHEKQYGEHATGIVFRRERVQLMELIERFKKILEPQSFKWHAMDKYFSSPNGSRLRFAYLDKDADAEGYQGHEYSRVYFEERGTFPREQPLNKLFATLRSGQGVPCKMKSTFNPGGVGHQHCRERYRLFDQNPKGYELMSFEYEHPVTKKKITKTRMFIPSKLQDNKYLGDDYVGNLYEACAGNEALLEAWLTGRWDIVEGAFFNTWADAHVLPEFEIPEDWLRLRSMCWGSSRPLSVGWWAVVGRDFPVVRDSGEIVKLPVGSLVRYREWYATKGKGSNEGMKLTAPTIAAGIKQREIGERIAYGVASPSIFLADSGPSIAERLGRQKIYFMPGDDAKASQVGHSGGWDVIRERLGGDGQPPTIYCFQSCADSVRTIPALQHDRDHPEEIDDESEIAAADDWRFACMSRPWVPFVAPPPIPDHIGLYGDEHGVTHSTLTFRQIIDRLERKRKSRED